MRKAATNAYTHQTRTNSRKTPWRYRFEPGDPGLRVWVVGLDPADIHVEVVRLLRARRAFLASLKLPPNKNMGARQVLVLLERMTVSTVRVESAYGPYPLLPGLLEPEPGKRMPTSVSRQAARSISRVLPWINAAISAPPPQTVQQYDDLLHALQQLRRRGQPFTRTVARMLRGGHTLMLAGRSYRFRQTG